MRQALVQTGEPMPPTAPTLNKRQATDEPPVHNLTAEWLQQMCDEQWCRALCSQPPQTIHDILKHVLAQRGSKGKS